MLIVTKALRVLGFSGCSSRRVEASASPSVTYFKHFGNLLILVIVEGFAQVSSDLQDRFILLEDGGGSFEIFLNVVVAK